MLERTLSLTGGLQVTIEKMDAGLTLIGADVADVTIQLKDGQDKDLTIVETESGPVVSSRANCTIQLPPDVPVYLHQVNGNLYAKDLHNLTAAEVRGSVRLDGLKDATLDQITGNLKASSIQSLRITETVRGNAALNDIAAVSLSTVAGNCQARGIGQLNTSRVNGNLHARDIGDQIGIDHVGGNVLLKNIDATVTAAQVGGNFAARGLLAGAQVDKINGNLALNGDIGPGCTYRFGVGGNAALRFNENASAFVNLNARGRIQSSMTLLNSAGSPHTLTGTLGEGGAEVFIDAGGNILLGGKGAQAGTGLSDEITRQVEESLRLVEEGLRSIDFEAMGHQVSSEVERIMDQLRVKLESVDWDRVGRRTQRSIERAIERMQREIDRVTAKAAQKNKGSVPASKASGQQPLDEERIAILKMVENGNISPGEAEMLLDAMA